MSTAAPPAARRRGLAASWGRAAGPPRDRQALGLHEVLVRPTRAGLAHAAGAVLILLASVNEQLALGHALAFLMVALGLVALGRCAAGLRGLVLVWTPPDPGHAGQPMTLRPGLEDPQGRARRGLRWALDGTDPAAEGAQAWSDRDGATGLATTALRWTPPRRGLHPPPRLRLDTRHPLGLACAWVRWQPATPLRVWPAVEADAPPPPAARAEAGAAPDPVAQASGTGELLDLRPARDGDPPTRLLWRASARSLAAGGPPWLGLRADGPAAGPAWTLRWADTAGAGDAEARLARLTAWLLQARDAGRAWRLELPGQPTLPEAAGAAACAAALNRLSEWTPPDEAA